MHFMRSYNLFFLLSFFVSCVAMEQELKPRNFYGEIENMSIDDLKAYTQKINTKKAVLLPGGYTYLHLAVMLNQIEEAFKIIHAEKYAIDEHGNEKGFTPLMVACREDDEEMVKLLLLCAADHSIPTKRGMTPLIKAIVNGNYTIVSMLLQCNADANQKDIVRGSTPLHMAIDEGSSEIVDLLLEYRASPNLDLQYCFTPLMAAVQMDIDCSHENAHNLCIIKSLLDAKADHAIAYLEDQDTALHIAVDTRKQEAVYLLLKAGADPNVLNAACETPLHIALKDIKDSMAACLWSLNKSCSIARLLLLYGAHVSKEKLKNIIDLNQLLTAGVVTNTSELVKLSLESGANANYKNAVSKTPLHLLARNPKKNSQTRIIACLLLGHGADLSLLDKKKRKALDSLLKNKWKHQQTIDENK